MSDVFVDNEIDYRDVALSLTRNCPNMSLPLLRDAFFEEVTPALASNGMTPAPEVWTGFDSDKVCRKNKRNAIASKRFMGVFRRPSTLVPYMQMVVYRDVAEA